MGFRSVFQWRPIDSAKSVLFSKMSPDPVEIYEVKRSQRYILAAIENK